MDWEGFFRDYRKPDFIPGYTILNKLGGGVFGDVYKAKKTSIGKFYAIKFLKLQDERLSEQVIRELDSVDHFAQVDHPNLVSIEDRGEVGGIPFIVMNYAGDETLKSLLRGGALDEGRANVLFRQIVQGVKALHEHSIVHFDLKPANIFINGDVARVGDYGLSKLMSESRGTLSMGRGTPYYMAPEMLRRKGDARSDVYSLGVIYYEMLMGDVPFKGDSEWEILKKHETEPVVIPDTMPASVAAFLRQALDKDPERRFRNAGALLTAFEAVVGGPSSSTGQHQTVQTPYRPLAAHRLEPARPLRMGEAAGRLAARGRVSLERGRKLMNEILDKMRDGSRDAMAGARRGYKRQWEREKLRDPSLAAGSSVAAAATASARATAEAARATAHAASAGARGFAFAGRGIARLVTLPFLLIGYVFSHLFQVVLIAAILFVLGGLIHLGLGEIIL